MHYEFHGLTNKEAPTLVFSSGLGGSAQFWQPQLAALSADYRILLYDHAGTGRSPATLPDDYCIEHMAEELLSLLDDVSVTSCHLIGHALGGLVGLELARLQPQRVQSLVLVNAWSSPNPHTLRCFNIRKALLAACEESIYLQMQALLLYPADWIAANIAELEREEAHTLTGFPNRANLLARIRALSEFDREAQLSNLHINTLVVANKDDMLVPWQRSQVLASLLPQAKLTLLDYGGHASSVTVPNEFNDVLLTHLAAAR